jgi:hypothetical protein
LIVDMQGDHHKGSPRQRHDQAVGSPAGAPGKQAA